MDGKKKRNKKKKGNQGKNTDDAVSNAGEAVPQDQNHEPALQENHNGTDADDAGSSVGDAVPQDQNQELAPQENHNGANVVRADVRSVSVSESDVELDKHKIYEAKFVNLHETIKELEDEKSSWLQKVSYLESELEILQNKLDYHVQNEALLEEKLNSLQNGYEALVKKEVVLDGKVMGMEGITDSLIQQETCLNETVSGLEEANKALQAQVKVLEESSNSMVEENQRLVKNLYELESRIQILEAKAILNESSTTKELAEENRVMDQMELTDPLLHQQTTGFAEVSMEGNELHTERRQSTNAVVICEGDRSQVETLASNAYPSNHLEESDEKMSETTQKNLFSVQFPEMTTSNHVARDTADVNVHPGPKPGLDEPRISEEIVAVPLDDIEIHEEEPPGAINETVGAIPLSDAPLIGAPFRLFSFVAKYVSGADLVNEKSLQSPRRAA